MIYSLLDLQAGRIELADFLMVTTFAMTLFPKMMQLLFSLRELAKKHTDISTYLKLLDEPVQVQDRAQPERLPQISGQISFTQVNFAYEGKNLALRDFSLDIEAGEAIALVGFSGAGKSTVAKLLMRMYDPQQGTINIDGIDIKNMRKSELRRLIGVVPQDPLLFNNSIYFNIAYAKQEPNQTEVMAAARAAGIDQFIKEMPKAYDTIVGERGIKLSGGQRQRLAIARVLLEQALIIVMDEATSSLDSASEQIIQRDGGIYQRLWQLQKNGFIGDGEE